MDDEKWQDTIGRIQDDFEVLEHETKELDDSPGSMEIIVFKSPAGKMKLERTTKPLVLDKKALGSKRIGSQTTVEYIYSETEKVHTMKAFKWDETQQGWIAMESERQSFSL
jgi:hypothetical protein